MPANMLNRDAWKAWREAPSAGGQPIDVKELCVQLKNRRLPHLE